MNFDFGLAPLLRYDEPDEVIGNRTTYMAIDDAIATEKILAASIRSGFVYEHDSDALLDFMTVHWAAFVFPNAPCRPGMAHAGPCGFFLDNFDCACGCDGADTWCLADA